MTTETPQEAAARKRRQDIEELWKLPAFRRFIFEVIDSPAWCGVAASQFDPRAPDALAQAYLEGRRSIGVQLNIEGQTVMPEMYVRALTEALNNRKRLAAPQVPPENDE